MGGGRAREPGGEAPAGRRAFVRTLAARWSGPARAGLGAARPLALDAARDLDPGYFALVMATGIISSAAGFYSHPIISGLLLAVAAAAFLALLGLGAIRLWRWTDQVAADLRSPQRAFGFFTLVAGAAVLGERLGELGANAPALALAALAGAAWVAVGYAVPASLIVSSSEVELEGAVSGSWLLWVVATQAISTTASTVAVHQAVPGAGAVAVITWGVGVVLYFVVISMLLLRLLTRRVRPSDLTAPYWIMMGATAITVLAGARILELPGATSAVAAVAPLVRGLSLVFWAFGSWLVPLLLILFWWRHLACRHPLVYRPGLWGMVFPLGMYAIASGEFGGVAHVDFMVGIGQGMLWPALAAWAAVFAAMLASLARAGAQRPR